MGKGKRTRRKEHAAKKLEQQKTPSSRWLYLVVGCVLVLAGGLGVYLMATQTKPAISSQQTASQPRHKRTLPATPRETRPVTLSPDLFSGKTARAYQTALDAPELIEQMPCYCDCYRGNGHQNNLDCYADRHAAT